MRGWKWRAGAAAVFGAAFALAANGARAEMGVCVTADIGIDGIEAGDCLTPDELQGLLDRPVRQGPNRAPPLELTHPDDFARRVPVRTCREFADKKAEDYYAMSGADIAAEGWYERTCATITRLIGARAPKRSFLARPDSGLSDVSVLTVRMLPVSAEAKREEVTKLAKQGVTIADLVAEGSVEVRLAKPSELELSYGGARAHYTKVARADFDGDGLEDYLVFMGVHSETGTMSWYETIALTRKRPRGLMELVTPES